MCFITLTLLRTDDLSREIAFSHAGRILEVPTVGRSSRILDLFAPSIP